MNSILDEFYEKVCRVFERGGDVSIREGPDLVANYLNKRAFVEILESRPVDRGYSRNFLCGGGDKPVIYVMQWSPGYVLMPHEHHGRSCFEFVLSGQHVVSDWMVERKTDDLFHLDLLQTHVVDPGQCAIVDAKHTDVHSVYTPVRSTSLHVYAADYQSSFGYVLEDDDLFLRREFALKRDES